MNNLFNSTIFTIAGTTSAQYKKMINTADYSNVIISRVVMSKICTIELSGYSIEADKEGKISKIERKANSSYMIVSDCVEDTKKINCWFCREKTGSWKNGFITNIKSHRPKGQDHLFEVYRRGYFCDEVCSYWYCLERKSSANVTEAREYDKSIKNMKIFTNRSTVLPDYSPWENLKYNGGALEYGQWKNHSYTFKRLPGYINCQAKCNYMIGH